MSHPGSFHQVATRVSLLTAAVLSGFLAFSGLPTSTSRTAEPGNAPESLAIEAENEVNGAIVLAVALAGSAAIGVGLTAVVERPRSSSSHRLPRNPATPHSSALSFAQVSHPLQRQLLRLLHDDRGAAHRLFVHASLKYPGNNPDWYAEKIIYDLVRDRGKY